MRGLVAIAVLVGCAGLSAAQEKYESKEGRYSVKFPDKPSTVTKKANDADVVTALTKKGDAAYLVTYSDLPAATVKNAKAKDLLVKGETALVARQKAKLLDSKDVEVGKHPGRLVLAEQENGHLRVLIVLAGNRVYQVVATGPKGVVSGPEGDAFFESFTVAK